MAVIGWGKPKVEFVKLSADGSVPSSGWEEMPPIVQDTAQLSSEKGNKLEALEEGGASIDVKYGASKYTFVCNVYAKKGDAKPIADVDGVVADQYAIRLTPEDAAVEGWLMERASVSVDEQWSSAQGKIWVYTFEGIKPENGSILKPYTATAG